MIATGSRARRFSFSWRRPPTAEQLLTRFDVRDEPLRADILSIEQLRHHAQRLAQRHELAARPRRSPLLARLDENARVLQEAHRLLVRAAAEGQDIPPGGVWLLDNYYLIQEQIRMARHHLPRKYSRQLPQLSGAASAGLPRVYDLALELITHVDGQIDRESLQQFVAVYQNTTPLMLGELWAIPIMLRLALIENLRRAAVRVVRQQRDQQWADAWAGRVLQAARSSLDEFLRAVSEMSDPFSPRERWDSPHGSAFVARFARRLNGHLPPGNIVAEWLAAQLADHGQTLDGLVNLDNQNQAADQVSMNNSITSLRTLAALDWPEFVESQSATERILRLDPPGVYERMRFSSRDRYRHAVELLARRSPLAEPQVARLAIERARSAWAALADPEQAAARGEEMRRCHVGYWLVGPGRRVLERSVGYRRTWRDVAAVARRAPLVCYLGAIGAVWLAALGGAAALAWRLGGNRVALPVFAAILLVFAAGAAGQFAVSIVNWLCTMLVAPKSLVRMDFSTGIPADCRTLVAVPTMLANSRGVANLLEQLETRWLSNRDDNLRLALLTDLADADRQTLPNDGALLDEARAGIERLNARYAKGRATIFYLLHRPREWNAEEGVWLGRERKRGKLAMLDRLLTTGATDGFSLIVGDLAGLAGVRYVITLDTDTQLPQGAARELVGCMAHPLNRPRIDPATRLVVEGYAILQPYITTTIPEAARSPFSRLFAGDAGIDPYTRETSDVYQDVFGQGSFIGKGIYDVRAFEAAVGGRFPDNHVLSHDLIEGCFARSGLLNDVELFEGFPSRLLGDMSRRHRWIRGDWQIAAWLGRRVPTERGAAANPLSGLARWKIFDNLRRSLVPILLLAFLALGWTLAPALAGCWTLLALAATIGPALISAVPCFLRKPEDKPWRLHLRDQSGSCLRSVWREAIHWSILPYTVHCHVDAIARTLYRLHVSHRRLLEWTTASDAEVRAAGSCRDYYELMCANTLVSLGLAAALAIVAPTAVAAAGPLLLAWLAGPIVAWRISQPCRPKTVPVTAAETRQLRRWARQTWHYFETFVHAEGHWLPPDNVQEEPHRMIAPRTSPTNIGMALLADLAACDLGYLTAAGLIQRTSGTLHTMRRLQRFRGHFFNWYDTQTLLPSEPRYVSSVDSGNLWGALCVLRAGLDELRDRPLVPPRLLEGLQDTVEVIAGLRGASKAEKDPRDACLARMRAACAEPLPAGARAACERLVRVHALATELAASTAGGPEALDDWAQTLVRQASAAHEELSTLAFWCAPIPLSLRERAGVRGTYDGSSTLDSPHPLPLSQRERGAIASHLSIEHNALLDDIDQHCTLRQVPEAAARIAAAMPSLRQSAAQAAAAAEARLRHIADLADLCQQLADADYRFLFDPGRKLLAIGFNVSEHRRDNSYYDLLASEARLTSFLAISHGQLPPEHWFALGRMVTLVDGEPTLLSWSGSMFEYLMPMLIMPSYPTTLLDASCRGAVRRQMRYARRQGVPWGISESCYNRTDAKLAYQYQAFGVPGLGLDRGLAKHLVIAPYAAAMAVLLVPREATANLALLERLGCLSPHGFYDALDCTPERRLPDGRNAPCRTVMAHHSGMALLAILGTLLDRPMQRRLWNDPLCRANDMLLQERVPQAIAPIDPETAETVPPAAEPEQPAGWSVRVFDTPHTPVPEVHLLSNGHYHVVLTNGGAGVSRCDGLAVTRWHAEADRGASGQFCYLRDQATGRYWSTTYQPTRHEADKYQAVFSQGKVEYRVMREEIDVRTQISVSPEDNVEVRRLTLANLARQPRSIELTTYAEIALADGEAAAETMIEWIQPCQAILCTRGGKGTGSEPGPWVFHLLYIEAAPTAPATFETNRPQFLGPTGTVARPAALEQLGPLSESPAPTRDPIASIRQAVTLAGEESAVAYVITGVAATREEALAVAGRYRDPRLAARVFELSAAHSRLTLQYLRITEADAQLYARMASALVYADPHCRINPTMDEAADDNPDSPRPLVLVRCSGRRCRGLVRQMIRAHAYWHGKGLTADLIIWLDGPSDGRAGLHQEVLDVIAATPGAPRLNEPGGIFLRRGDAGEPGHLRSLAASARICLSDDGPLEDQLAPPRHPSGEGLKPVLG